MRIRGISVFQVDLPLHEGRYAWAGGRSIEVFDSTIVRIDTDGGLVGLGEVCPLGARYLPAYAAGARTGIGELAPHLLGVDPTETARVNAVMDAALQGHPYVKSALDMACWDILGQACGQPVCRLLGGRLADTVPLYRAISQDTPAAMAERVARYRDEGYRTFQLKVGGQPEIDVQRVREVSSCLSDGDVLIADANTGWLTKDAARVVRQLRDVDVFIEQPCATYEECLTVRRQTDHPFVLDESIDGPGILLRAHADHAMDAVNLKISKLGGLTKTRLLRDLCLAMGIAVTIEDSWGSDIATAAIAHLAQSTPPTGLLSTTDFNSYVTITTADGAPRRVDGCMAVSAAPGLGIELREDVVGPPLFRVS